MIRLIKQNSSGVILALLAATMTFTLGGCGSNGNAASTSTTTPTTVTATVASLSLSATPLSVKSDNSTSSTLTVTAVDASNAAVSGAVVSLSADTGFLSNNSVTTSASGTATFTFSSGTSSSANRTATITASSGAVSKIFAIQIVGSTVTVSSTANTLPDNGTIPSTFTVTANDFAGNFVPNTSVTLSQSGPGKVTFTPASGLTDANGVFTSTVAGATAGATVVTATAVGATATNNFTVSPTSATFQISSTTNGGTTISFPLQVSMKIGDSLVVSVNAPGAANVRFVSSMGVWNGGTLTATVPVSAGVASATLTTTKAGIASVYVDNPAATSSNASLVVAMTATTAYQITLQANPSLISKSVGTTKGVSTLLATVTDSIGQPVGDAPIAFSIVNPTGGGESVSPAFALSASTTTASLGLGQAVTSFTSGSLSSIQSGIQVRAQVLGTTVSTQTPPSGNDASIIIGGTAASIAYGSATVLKENQNASGYILSMSVTVADSNGNPAPLGTVVNLSIWPVAWSTGAICKFDADGPTAGTFLNEDANENLFLDPVEDGTRTFYADLPAIVAASGVGTTDGLITPSSSAAGTVPASVITDATGTGYFDLNYGKNSAIWIIARLRARTVVQGSSAMNELDFRLPALASDVTSGACKLPDSPYKF